MILQKELGKVCYPDRMLISEKYPLSPHIRFACVHVFLKHRKGNTVNVCCQNQPVRFMMPLLFLVFKKAPTEAFRVSLMVVGFLVWRGNRQNPARARNQASQPQAFCCSSFFPVAVRLDLKEKGNHHTHSFWTASIYLSIYG